MRKVLTLAGMVLMGAAYYVAADPPCTGNICCWLATASEPACPSACQSSYYTYTQTGLDATAGVYYSSNNSCSLAWQASQWIKVNIAWTAFTLSGGQCTTPVLGTGTVYNADRTLKNNVYCSS